MNPHPIEKIALSEEQPQPVVGYEAPAIESVLTPELLEREVHYAGNIPVSGSTPIPT